MTVIVELYVVQPNAFKHRNLVIPFLGSENAIIRCAVISEVISAVHPIPRPPPVRGPIRVLLQTLESLSASSLEAWSDPTFVGNLKRRFCVFGATEVRNVELCFGDECRDPQ